jgi:hypothetical protein
LQKIGAFLLKTKLCKLCKIWIITLVFEKNANIFAENWQKSPKIVIITSTPDWANLRLLGNCFPWTDFLNYRRSPYIWACLFRGKCYVLILTKTGLGHILEDVLKQIHLVTLVAGSKN